MLRIWDFGPSGPMIFLAELNLWEFCATDFLLFNLLFERLGWFGKVVVVVV